MCQNAFCELSIACIVKVDAMECSRAEATGAAERAEAAAEAAQKLAKESDRAKRVAERKLVRLLIWNAPISKQFYMQSSCHDGKASPNELRCSNMTKTTYICSPRPLPS